MKINRALFAIALCSPFTVGAEPFESETLFSKGAWEVEITFDTEDSTFWCEAATDNRANQSFSIVAYDTGTAAIFVFDPRWNLSERSIKFLIDIDYSRWEISGRGSGRSVSSFMHDGEKAGKFLKELSQGNAVAIYNSDEKRLATFSLSGSSAALNALMECWTAIRPNGADHTSSDPFRSSKDPF